jgi:secondary thiamine-phosphate synthase enzyme
MEEMILYRTTLTLQSQKREELVDITAMVVQAVKQSGVSDGMVFLYAQGATAAIMIQENWDDSVQEDAVALLAKLIPRGVWRHDLQDGNGDAPISNPV